MPEVSEWIETSVISAKFKAHASVLVTLLTFFLSLEFELVCECVITYDLDFLNLPNLANPSNVSQCLGFPSRFSSYLYTAIV